MLKRSAVALTLVALLVGAGTAQGQTAKNVILMISDGQGFNHVLATDYYTGTPAVYHEFETKLGMANFSGSNGAYQAGGLGYDPAQMASNGLYANIDYTDSASAASAMYTGQKIYDGQINMTTDGQPMKTYFEQAADLGRSMGAVSSVQMTHATPAAVYGHNLSRGNYAEIGTEGVTGSNPTANNAFYDSLNYNGQFKVLMGAGHGAYDNNGQPDESKSDKYAGGTATWEDIRDGAAPNGWTFVEEKADFEAIAAGTSVPEKLLGIAQVNSTLQYSRSAGAPMNSNVPTLATMTSAALNVLGQNEDGFTVMVEGGAVDWAGHGNNLERMIEEQIDFNNSVEAAIEWVEDNSNWDETLLIVTADHETGYLLGPDGFEYTDVDGNGEYTDDDILLGYKHVEDNGAGNLPGVEWFSGSHTNQLVPLFAKGAGAELFEKYIDGTDPNLADYYGLDGQIWDGDYIDNTDLYSVMMEASEVPEPATMALLGLGGLVIARRRRRSA